MSGSSEFGLSDFIGCAFLLPSSARDTAAIEGSPPDDNLVWIANIVDRRNLLTEEPLTSLMRQHLELEISSVGTAFWLHADNSAQPVVTDPSPNPLLGHLPTPREQLRAAFSSQKALNDFALELCFVLPHETP